jgi:3-deoxy-D-manno-octulosonic-acid transferase
MMFSLYRGLGTISGPLIEAFLNRRLKRGKEDPERFDERLGISSKPRPEGALVWLHAASVGESLSLLPLIERFRLNRPRLNILITTGTVTSAKLMAERLPDDVIHQFVPVDRALYVKRFFDHWRPDLVLWAESEFWPNLVLEPKRRNIPLVLINGRVSPKSFRGWKRFPWVIRKLLSGFSLCLGQTATDVSRLLDLGAQQARSVGNLKFAVPPLPVQQTDFEALRSTTIGRTVFLAASTHPGEEEELWQANKLLAKDIPNLLTIIVPRHPDRGGDIAASLSSFGAHVALRSKSDNIETDTDIYIADTMGELGLFYRLANLVFMGKSLVNMGGQNLLEAARLDCAIFHGPHMWNFADIVTEMTAENALVGITDADDLAKAVNRIHNDPTELARLANTARSYAEAKADVLDAVVIELDPYLNKTEAAHESA